MIRFEDVSVGPFRGLTFQIEAGTVCKIVTEAAYEKQILVQVLAGHVKPDKGRILLFGRDIWGISELEALELYQRVGLVHGEGGLISNLKVWENIALPLWYHKGVPPEEVGRQVADWLTHLGFDAEGLADYVHQLPGNLPAHERRLMALVRAMLMEPELMIFEEMLKQLTAEVSKRVLGLTREFHAAVAGRTSVYVGPDEQAWPDLEADLVLRQKGRGVIS